VCSIGTDTKVLTLAGARIACTGAKMPLPTDPDQHPLVCKLRTTFNLTAEEEKAIVGLPLIVKGLDADEAIVREGDQPSHCCLLLEGFAYRSKILEGGKRQILSFHTPGDIPDLRSLHLEIMDHNLAALTNSKMALISHDALRALMHAHPRIGDAFWRETLIDAAIFREWVANVGRRAAYPRVAHVLCEHFLRLKLLGLTDGITCEFPMTQEQLGDATGLSNVHVNRVLQELRKDGLIATTRKSLTVKDWDRLREVGEFDATYLHVRGRAAPSRRVGR